MAFQPLPPNPNLAGLGLQTHPLLHAPHQPAQYPLVPTTNGHNYGAAAAAADDDDDDEEEEESCTLSAIHLDISTPLHIKGDDNVVALDPALSASKLAMTIVSAMKQMSQAGGVPMIDQEGRPRPVRVSVVAEVVIEGQGNVLGERGMLGNAALLKLKALAAGRDGRKVDEEGQGEEGEGEDRAGSEAGVHKTNGVAKTNGTHTTNGSGKTNGVAKTNGVNKTNGTDKKTKLEEKGSKILDALERQSEGGLGLGLALAATNGNRKRRAALDDDEEEEGGGDSAVEVKRSKMY